MIKPAGAVYDTVNAGLIFYSQSITSTYKLSCSNDSLFVEGGGFNKTYLQNISFGSGDTLGFKAIVTTQASNKIPDQKTNVQVWLKKNSQGEAKYFENDDVSQRRIFEGYPGFCIDLSKVNNLSGRNLEPITITNITVQKQ